MSWRSYWERIVVKRATPLVVLVAAVIGLAACASKTETVSTAAPPPAPPPAYAPAPPPEPYVAPAPVRKRYVSMKQRVRHVRPRGTLNTTTPTTPAPAP